MNVSLTPELEKWVQGKVETGLYGSSSEVIRDALRLLYQFEGERQRKLENLKSELQLGFEQIKTGESEKMSKGLMSRIKKEGRQNLNA